MTAFNWLDALIILSLVLFCLIGFVKGFTQRILSLMSWIGAIVLSFKFYPFLRPLVEKYIASGTPGIVLTSAVLFITLLVLFKLLTAALSTLIQKSPLKGLDRLLGIFFSLAVGTFILSIAAIVVQVFFTGSQSPDVMRTSKLWPWVLRGQGYIEDFSPLKQRELAKELEKHNPLKDVKIPSHEETGYQKKERSALDHLVDKVDSKDSVHA